MSHFVAPRSLSPPCRLQGGQSMVEYMVVCTAIVIALGIGMIGPNSVLRDLLDAFQQAYQNFSFAISLPT